MASISSDILTAAVWLPVAVGFAASLFVCVLLVLTQRVHGHLTNDDHEGVQKFHRHPTPRIGGFAIACGYIAVFPFLHGEIRDIWLMTGLAGSPALLAGLVEDISRKVGVKWRLGATMLSGVIFALLTGYAMSKVDLPGVDWVLALPVMAVLFTGFAMGGVANAINIIDGFNGLASGTLLIMFGTFAFVAWRVGDPMVMSLALLYAALVAGFFVMNFPLGNIFLGDGGAYFGGFLLATLGVLLPTRNADVSAWLAILICGYPVIETISSMWRKSRRNGHSVGKPDRVHFHMLAYRRYGRKIAGEVNGRFDLRNPATSLVTWILPALTAVFAASSYNETWLSAVLFFVTVFIYAQVYSIMSLNGPRLRFW